jgi:hypothetical protein
MTQAQVRSAVPIVILHRNEFDNLELMLASIVAHTLHPYSIFVVDNNSSRADSAERLDRIAAGYSATVIRSNRNNWVFGFNIALAHPQFPLQSTYYVFSDSDIVVPPVDQAGRCWLGYLTEQLDQHACIGKLGMSLAVGDIDNSMLRNDVLKQRARFDQNPRIGANVIAPVDTTLAIYRPDFFVGSRFGFSVGHASLARPYYFTCRTPEHIEARHLGWYEAHRIDLDDAALTEKIRCFARYGAYIEPALLKRCPRRDSLYYRVVHPMAILYWGTRVAVSNLCYLVKHFPRRTNLLQYQCR